MPYEAIILDKEGHLATITLNKPEKNNAFDEPMMAEIDDAINDVAQDRGVRAVIITGAGKGFCAGGDVSYLQVLMENRSHIARTVIGDVVRRIGTMPTVVLKIRHMMKPVIAAVNGVAAGGGMGLAAACDMRIASDKARFSTVFIKRGVIPDCAATFTLPRLVGMAKACELVLKGNVIDAAEAERIGLVNMAVPGDRLMSAAREMAAEIAQNSSFSIRMIKKGLQMAGEVSLEALMDYEIEACLACVSTKERRESLTRFEERKRT